MFGTFPIKNVLKQGGTLLPIFSKFALENGFSLVQAK